MIRCVRAGEDRSHSTTSKTIAISRCKIGSGLDDDDERRSAEEDLVVLD